MTVKQPTKGVRDRLSELKSATDCQVVWKVDLESCLGKAAGKAEPAWQAREIEPKTPAAIERDLPDYREACEAIRQWVLQ